MESRLTPSFGLGMVQAYGGTVNSVSSAAINVDIDSAGRPLIAYDEVYSISGGENWRSGAPPTLLMATPAGDVGSATIKLAGDNLRAAAIGPGDDIFVNYLVYVTSQYSYKEIIARYRPDGTLVWQAESTILYSMTEVDITGASTSAGTIPPRSSVDLDPGPQQSYFRNTNSSSVSTLLRLDPNGAYRWAVVFDKGIYINDMVASPNGDTWVLGSFSGTVDFDPGPGTTTVTAMGSKDCYLARFNDAGELVSVGTWGGPDSFSEPNSIAETSTGDFLIAGLFKGTFDFDPGPGTHSITSASAGGDGYVLRLDYRGEFKSVLRPTTIWGTETKSVLRTGPHGEIFAFNGNELFELGPDGDPTGFPSWTLGGAITDVAVTLDGTIWVTGAFSGTVDFDPGPGVANLTSSNNGQRLQGYALTLTSRPDIRVMEPSSGQWIQGTNQRDHIDFSPIPPSWNPNAGWTDITAIDIDNNGSTDVIGRTAGGEWWALMREPNGEYANHLLGQWNPDAGWRDVHVLKSGTYSQIFEVVGRTASGEWWVSHYAAQTLTSFLLDRWNPDAGWQDVQVVDLNNDIFPEIIGRTATGEWWVTLGYILYTGQHGQTVTWNPDAGWRDVQLADVNGDGFLDLLGRTAEGEWWTGINLGNGTFRSELFGVWNPDAGWINVSVIDMTGDGKADIVGQTAAGEWFVSVSDGNFLASSLWETWNPAAGWHDVQICDFDGDGRLDLAGRTASGEWWVGLQNRTRSGFTTTLWGVWNEAAGWTRPIVLDFEHDGRIDLLSQTAAGEWWLASSTGLGFVNRRLGALGQPLTPYVGQFVF